MRRDAVEWAMIALGLVSGVLLVLWGISFTRGSAETAPVFWVFVALFLAYIGWDVRRHLRGIASRPASLRDRNH